MTDFKIAPAGTRDPGSPLWRDLPPGMTLTFGIDGTHPDVAVLRDGVLLCDGEGLTRLIWEGGLE